MPKNTTHEAHTSKIILYIIIAVIFGVGVFIGLSLAHIPAKAPVAPTNENAQERVCEVVESKLMERIENESDIPTYSPERFLDNAQVYVDLVNWGCPENADKFRAAATRQLEIANALHGEINQRNTDRNFNQMQMQIYRNLATEQGEFAREFRRILDKANRLGEPAIQFVAEVERIFSE
ncbi:MAG: hypothetical protein FWF34_02060 [Alphaproteobacteria bacterium]|nr:hypothetical protein [Alphaproteobacteria bacterium]MCL2890016.1 hypothetical protein [Alphaproteobacteria bacterium]